MRDNLKQARRDACMTQQEVAYELDITLRYYKMIEAGTVGGMFKIWDKLEDMFHLPQRFLRENDPDQADSQ